MKKVENALFFLYLDQLNGTQSQLCKIKVSDKEVTDPNENKIK